MSSAKGLAKRTRKMPLLRIADAEWQFPYDSSVPWIRRPWFAALFFGVLVFATRYPLRPGQLVTFDDVNFAYSIGHFDIRASQPHPPGYPLFVMELRTLWWLRFRRMETLLFALAVAGSIAALAPVAVAGNRMMGGDSGFCAACLLVLHPVFWHAGITSAVRVQLAVVSMAVAACCWRAWRGHRRWVLWSAVVLGLGAGIRPETGPLLFPLWAACALRARVGWRAGGRALAAMAGAVLVWLAPAMLASGGPVPFVRACLDYLSDQASVSSGLFGAAGRHWETTFWHTVVWTLCGLPGCGAAAVLAWRRRWGWEFGWERLAFLALWFAPAFAFAILVHVEDPGHALAMLPPLALAAGYLVSRALDLTQAEVSPWWGAIVAAASLAVAWIVDRHSAEFAVLWLPAACLGGGLVLRMGRVKNFGVVPRAQVLLVLLAPAALLDVTMFLHRGWYYRGAAESGWHAAADRIEADLASGLALTSAEHIAKTLAVDDHTIREVRRLAAERPGETVVAWESGPAAWRKIAYYAPELPVAVLDHRRIRAGSPAVVAWWRGNRLERPEQSGAPVRMSVPAGARVIWVLKPGSEFEAAVRGAFAAQAAGPVWYTDLPESSGSRPVGEYEIAW